MDDRHSSHGRAATGAADRRIDRRSFLKGSVAATALAALVPWRLAHAQDGARDLIVVSDSGAGGSGESITLIDPATLEVVGTASLAGGFAFPATRWGFMRDLIWSGLPAGPEGAVAAYRLSTGERAASFATGSSQNYTELTPDGRLLIVAARFEDTFYALHADPVHHAFASPAATLRTYDGAGPCDITIHPSGAYAYAPDRGGDTLTVLALDPFRIVATIPVESDGEAPLEPYMATASPSGDALLVENAVVDGGSSTGSESLFDLSDPARPVEVARFQREDGLGAAPLTSEITPDGRFGLVVCRDSSEVTAIDLRERQVAASVRLPNGSSPFTGTLVFGSGGGDRFFVPLPGRDAVAVVTVPGFEVAALIPVGARPQGAVYLRAPVPERAEPGVGLGRALGTGRSFPAECPDPCCGPI